MKYDYLEKKLKRIIKEAIRIVDNNEMKDTFCSPKCISCLVAQARGNDDKKQFDGSNGFFDSSEDVAMIDAKYELLKMRRFKDWKDN